MVHELRVQKDSCKEYLKLLDKIDFFKEMTKTRPNVAFLYNPELTTEDKEKLALNHPELVSITDIESQNPEAKEGLRTLNRFFEFDSLDGRAYIDTSIEGNAQNYEILKENLGNYISLQDYAEENNIDPNFLLELAGHRSIDRLKLINKTNGKIAPLELISKDVLGNADNVKKLIPQKSKYYKQLLRDKNEPLMVPIAYLSKLGYGTPQELYKNFKKGYFKGIEKEAIKDGKVKKAVYIDISSTVAENNLEKMRIQNKNYYTVKELAEELHIKTGEVEKAIISGELEPNNEYIFSRKDYFIGVNLNNPKNAKFSEKILFEQEAAKEILKKSKLSKEEAIERKEKNRTLVGLRTKIAWHLSPKTRQIASEIAMNDGYLAKILAKEARINEQDENSENKEFLTRAELIKLNKYRKNYWQEAGTEEFSIASKKAKEIVEIYQTEGLDGIEDSEIRKIIEDYLS